MTTAPRPQLVTEELHQTLMSTSQAAIAPSGGGPHDPGMEARVAKLEADVEHIKQDVSDIKGILSRLAPVVDRMDGFLQATLPALVTKTELSSLVGEIGKRPTRRQSLIDLGLIAGLVAALLAIGSHFAR